MHRHYNTRKLTLEEKHAILHQAKEKCDKWWVDVLDCNKSWARERIDMSFEDMMIKLNQKSLFVIIHRNVDPENYLEVGFSTLNAGVDYFLWIHLDVKHLNEFTKGLE